MAFITHGRRAGLLSKCIWCSIFCIQIEYRPGERECDLPIARSAAVSHTAVLSHLSSIFANFGYNSVCRFTPFSTCDHSSVFIHVQSEVRVGWLLEVGYVGTRGLHLVRQRSLNQALSASVDNPIRGATTNTIENIPLRQPILGILPDSGVEMESEGSSWYNGLEVSLTKWLNHGLQFLASSTFSKTLDTDGADINSTSSGNPLTLGDQNSAGQRWGRASFDRTHRFVLSGIWALPSPHGGFQRAVLGRWDLASIVTVQSGNALTIANTSPSNVFGISEDRAELAPNCNKIQLITGGSMRGKLNSYFNTSCFTTPPVIGQDGIGTGFGNSGTGIVDGPPQRNVDLALKGQLRPIG